jgi:ketosteroid isomerase-like protein
MSQEHIEIVRAMWEPMKGVDGAEIDWDAEVLREGTGQFSPDFELTWTASWAGERHYTGQDAMLRAFKEWVEPFSEYRAEALDYIEAGDHVIVVTRQWGTGRASGAPVEIRVTHLMEFRDGLIARLDEYETVEEAIESAEQRK